ncbi:MAG: ATP-binding cassette domain-containing protein, partial [Candidatus Nomurabacteria bacterium]|nr:ATP-binding cassette domain-containing protein [Candidatus Nomurabacteria bacterium]
MKNIITVTDLTKRYGDKTAVDGISFSVRQGEIFGILGPNGAGKTTTMEMMEALRTIDSGKIILSDIDVAKHPYKIKHL